MAGKPGIICACGRRIEAREVLQHGYFMTHWRPVWVYVKYRCSRCRMMGEKLVDYKHWDESVLEQDNTQPSTDETARFVAMGAIGDDEVKAFAEGVSLLRRSDLDQLAQSLS